ncbi:hypothetical protein GCM10027087_64490 [Paractinoplanes abujensis]|uniref:Uncharacterized protein n=1 Tax=Paractinoplanes abujensis TaxID=882441 RepID=A0A7W7G4E7_9ACTN|nr:hypothetical protein [Actinoplanes abujensis]
MLPGVELPDVGRPYVEPPGVGPPEPRLLKRGLGASASDEGELEASEAGAAETGAEALIVPEAGCGAAHRAPGAGGGGGAYPSWSPASGRAAGGFMPSLSGVACRSSMDPPDRRVPTGSVVGR